ncbi:TadE family protein [Cystobacter ferrugineus]|uniref:Pilus assembly protein n=1 Tax=Cystobacter ferrugineus TaxID=83449 RepID=A0A1L9BH30_9BACT|nr:TadE family protein [Cystobacter ferrugineus]OJH41594.1 pilus assembly protein [Cystobacter ferrugineus]
MEMTPTSSRESGQAAVEAALIVPLMVFMVLGIIQLGMMHHARLMTEYAAYRSARAGIVNHAHCELMRNAALVSVLPTLGPTPSGQPGRVDTLLRAAKHYREYAVSGTNNPVLFHIPGKLEKVRVEVLNPKKSQLSNLFSTYGDAMKAQEIDYDDVRDDAIIRANLLSVRITYFYEMRIPFANWLIHGWFMGFDSLDKLKGIQFENQRLGGQASHQALEKLGASKGKTSRQKNDYKLISGLATGQRKYIIPLVTTYSMRMQSNMMQKHVSPCAVDE